jgi:protein TonB
MPAALPPPPPPRPPEPIRPGGSVRPPAKIVHVAPQYPQIARASRVQGIVIIEATIDSHGNVESTAVLRSIPLLDQAALDAVRQWKFTPTLLNGIAVPVIMTVTVNFELSQ